METKLLQKARKFAECLHEGQFRKDGATPYITHPEAVVNLLICTGIRSEDILCAAWLHDAIEDCNFSKEDIEKEFNPNIAEIVFLLTRNVGREEYKMRIRRAGFSVKIIKLADMIHNCSDMHGVYVSEKTRTRKINDCSNFYFDLAKQIFKPFYYLLQENLKGGVLRWN